MSKKILLADDSVTIQKVVSITLAHEDFELIIVDNGTEAVIKAKEIRPDIILLDVVMPDKDGYEVCQEIKASNGLSTIPIILLTGTFEPFDEDKATEVGADDFIKKPFESHALINKIKEMIFKSGVKEPVTVVDAEVEEIDGLDELEGIDDLSGFDEFETPTETRLSETPINAPSTDLSRKPIDVPEVSLESPLDIPEVSLETPLETPKPADPIMTEAIREVPHIETGTTEKDDIWSVEKIEDISGDEKSLDIEETSDLWGDEEIAAESVAAMPETTVIEETGISEDTIVLDNGPEMTEPNLGDGGFELGSDISIGDLENSADDNMFDDVSTGAKVSGDDLFPDEIPEEPLGDVELSVEGGSEFNDGGFGVETSPLDVPAVGIEISEETTDGFDMDEFGTDAPVQAPTPQGIELPDGGVGDLPFTEPVGGDSFELDWGDDSGGFSESEGIFAFEDDFSDGGGGVGATPEAGISKDFESAPSESVVGETEWDLGEVKSTPDTIGGFVDDASTIAMDAGVESQVEPQSTGDISGGDMAGRSEEISRMVKETIVDGGILSEAGIVGKSEKEIGAAVDKVAREIVQKVVWEVVPELAEELIKDEIRRLKGEKEV